MSIIQGTSKTSAAGGYTIDQSIRFNFSDAAHLLRTPSTASNRRTWTWSLWVKRSGLGNPGGPNQVHQLFGVGAGSCLRFTSSDQLRLETPAGNHTFVTSQVFRDTSAWYHIVLAFDSTQATDTDRRKLYVNGSQVTDFSSTTFTGLAQNAEWDINSTSQHQIAKSNLADYFGGYLAEINFVDGQALAPTDFGETNADTGQWVPVRYTGSYGTNGFYITGADSADLGADDSGNGNDFTSSGLTAADQVTDSPTDNFAVLNPLANYNNCTFADGNLKITLGNATQNCTLVSTMPMLGKTYFEWTVQGGSAQQPTVGILQESEVLQIADGSSDKIGETSLPTSIGYERDGSVDRNNVVLQTYTAFSNGDVGMCAYDPATRKVWFGREGTFNGDPAAGTGEAATMAGTDDVFAGLSMFSTNGANSSMNFGQLGFEYTPPTGYKALSTASLDDPNIADPSAYFQTLAYASTGTSTAFVQDGNSQFEPGLVWVKSRTGANNHLWFDQVRGATKFIRSDTTNTENTVADTLTAFNSNGFTAGADSINWGINYPGRNNVAWMWAADGTSGSSNTDGSITSTVSANTTSGFSIIRWSGTAANGTIGHGLGLQPSLYIVKNTATTNSWLVGSTLYSNTQFLILNSTAALDTAAAVWNSAYPTSSVINLGSNAGSNGSGTNNMICYAFAEVEGFSQFGSYTGNGSTDGPFIYTGFKPSFIMYKRTSGGTGNWDMLDIKRDPINVSDAVLAADKSTVETTYATIKIDMVSNGYKIRGTQTNLNASGSNYIYMAFASSPFKTTTAQ